MIILVILTASSIFGQQMNLVPELSRHDYLQKSKNQKTAAFLLLGSGVVVDGISLMISVAHASKDAGTILINAFGGAAPPPKRSYKTENSLLIIGTTAILSSIPLFAFSAKNKKKAIRLSLENQMIRQVQNKSFVKIAIPSLSVHINL